MARAFVESFARPAAERPGWRAPRVLRLGRRRTRPRATGRPRLPVDGRAEADNRPVTVLTGTYGARVLGPLLASHPRDDVELRAVPNDFFGGNIGVAGLLTGEDVARALEACPDGSRCLLPDACLTRAASSTGSPCPTCRGPSRWCPPTAARCASHSTARPSDRRAPHDRADGGRRRSPERGQVLTGQPHRGRPRRGGRRGAGGDPRPQGADGRMVRRALLHHGHRGLVGRGRRPRGQGERAGRTRPGRGRRGAHGGRRHHRRDGGGPGRRQGHPPCRAVRCGWS